MKKFLLILTVLVGVIFFSCERRCVCKYLDDGTEEVIYSAYSKSECSDWDTYLNNDLHTRADCTYRRYN